MNKTLYVKDEDGPIWDKARELTGDKLSSFVMEKLRAYVSERAARKQGYNRIVVKYNEHGIPKAKAFSGRWIFPPQQPLKGTPDDINLYIVAETAKGQYVVVHYCTFLELEEDDDSYIERADFHVFETVEAIAQLSAWVAAETMKRLGVQVQELDI